MNDNLSLHEQDLAWIAASASAEYFIREFVQIESPEREGWAPFDLWPEQVRALETLVARRQVVVLKARQLGLSWLCVAYALWLMLFRAPAVVLLFSLREAEAKELMARLRGIYAHLPEWMQSRATMADSSTRWELSNGSRAHAFSTRGGRSYTASLALVDEADFVPHLEDFLNAVKPTIDGGGQLALVSTADKARPLSAFKRLFRAAWAGTGDYAAIFLPWSARPARDEVWYARVRAEMRAQRGSDDDLFQEYPATPEEAMRVRSSAARLAPSLVEAALAEATPLPLESRVGGGRGQECAPLPGNLAGLKVFAPPRAGVFYVCGADPAEGNPARDESAATLFEAETGEQVAVLAGAIPPDLFAQQCAALCAWYGAAAILVERNNHGHAVLGWLQEAGATLVRGRDGKAGWLTTAASKSRLYDELERALRGGEVTLHDGETAAQLASIEATTLRAPAGLHDDRAMAAALALAARAWGVGSVPHAPVAPADVVAGYDRGGFA